MRNIHFLFLLIVVTSSCKNDASKSIVNHHEVEVKTVQNITSDLKLTSIILDKSIDFSSPLTAQTIISAFGDPLRIETEKPNKIEGVELWTIINYPGIQIEMEGDFISEIKISNENWKINEFNIGDNENEINSKLEKLDEKWEDYTRYKLPNLDGVLYCKFNQQGAIVELGISAPNN